VAREPRPAPIRFHTTLEQFGGNNTGIEVPEEILAALGRGRRVKVVATVNGYKYRTSVAPAMGRILMPFSSGHRAATGIRGGDEIDVELVPDDEPREAEVPSDLAAALEGKPDARAFFDGLSFTNQRLYTLWIEDAKKAETRAGRVAKAVEMLTEHRTR
jgi:hypothetical protein